MYAIIRTGGKQYKVQAGDVLQVEKLEQDLGKEFDISEVLMIGGDAAPHIGQPIVKNAKVTVVVTKQARTRKVIVFKKKRRQGYRRFNTHKQDFTEIFIKAIASPDGKVTKAEAAPKVIDIAAVRTQRIADKQADRKARAEAAVGSGKAATETLKQEAKKIVKKKAAKKAVAKKATKKPAAKKATKKKAAKKTSKKT
ncbi:MAG: 50S ribosomal protein L21 [Pseudobdellovibrionaceae bacterium]